MLWDMLMHAHKGHMWISQKSARVRPLKNGNKINSCNMKLLNYVRVKSGVSLFVYACLTTTNQFELLVASKTRDSLSHDTRKYLWLRGDIESVHIWFFRLKTAWGSEFMKQVHEFQLTFNQSWSFDYFNSTVP